MMISPTAFVVSSPHTTVPLATTTPRTTQLWSSQAEEEQATATSTEEVVEEEEEEETKSEEEEADAEEDTAPPPPSEEELEVQKLQGDITALEATLKQKRLAVNSMDDKIDEYSKSGYARMVAEIDQMRRLQSSMADGSQDANTAEILQSLMPVREILRSMLDKEKAQPYHALASDFEAVMKGLKVTEFTPSEGDVVLSSKHEIVGQEYSGTVAKKTILSVANSGLELGGTIIKKAQCIESLGKEDTKEEKKEEEVEEEPASEEAPPEEAAE